MRRTVLRFMLFIGILTFSSVSGAVALQMKEVAPGVFVHQGSHLDFDDDNYNGDIANISFVIGTKSVAVIDTGGSYDVGVALKEAIKAKTALPVKYVINTHVHPDHILGNAAFAQKDVSFVGHANLPAVMYESQDTYLRDAPPRKDGKKNTLVMPTIKVAEQYTIDLGGRQLLLRSWPSAHTTTDLTVLDQKTDTFWTGDLLFTERTPSVDGDVKSWIDVIGALRKMTYARVVPGHGSIPENPAGAWDTEKHYLQLLISDISIGIKEGKDMSEVMQSAASSEKDKWQRFDVINPRNVNLLFPKMEWE